MNDPVMDRPNHPWNDPDGDGHNCTGCPPESMWKCDEAAHPAAAAAWHDARPAFHRHAGTGRGDLTPGLGPGTLVHVGRRSGKGVTEQPQPEGRG